MRPLARDSTRVLLSRLWREHLRPERGTFVPILALTLLAAGATALYPVVIDHAFTMFADKDPRILYQIPVLVVIVTGTRAAAQYGQSVLVQKAVLRLIRELQVRMFEHLVTADLARVEREPPAQLATRFTTDAAVIREALSRGLNGLGDAFTLVGLFASMLWLDWLLTLI
ncbi:MAG: ABC transporter transmembrane domain-containing protein, partial [Acetobacteraceae bacterium]